MQAFKLVNKVQKGQYQKYRKYSTICPHSAVKILCQTRKDKNVLILLALLKVLWEPGMQKCSSPGFSWYEDKSGKNHLLSACVRQGQCRKMTTNYSNSFACLIE